MCDGWFTACVTTCDELDQALKTVEQDGTAAYIEVVTDTYEAPPIAKKIHESYNISCYLINDFSWVYENRIALKFCK